MNHYEILEVSANASQEVIRAAYRSLMQRYHPDRNPDNAETARRAMLVNQAYAVLSDANKRTAYDIELKQQATERVTRDKRRDVLKRRASVAKDSEPSWFVWLLIASILLSGWWILSLSGKLESPESELRKIHQSFKNDALTEKQRQDKIKRIEQIFREHPEVFKKEASDRAKAEESRIIPFLIERLTVNLKVPGKPSEDPGRFPDSAGKLSEDTGHVLFIPVLGVKVGSFDPEKAIGYIERNKALIGQKLAEKLASANYEELNKGDGEDYLKNIILDSIGETTGTDRREDYPPSTTEAPGRYGAIDVLLPKSFSVR